MKRGPTVCAEEPVFSDLGSYVSRVKVTVRGSLCSQFYVPRTLCPQGSLFPVASVSQVNMVDNETMKKGPTVCTQDPTFPSFRVLCSQA